MTAAANAWLATTARLSTLALAAALLGYAGDWHWLLDLAAHFRWQYLLALSVGLVAAVIIRKRGLALLLAAGWLLNGWSLLTANGPAPAWLPAAVAAPATSLTLLVVNVHVGLNDVRPLLDLIAREAPDVIGIIELSPTVAGKLAVLDADYPARATEPRDDPFGIGVWSRLPTVAIETIESPPLGHPSLSLRLAAPGAANLWLTHPFPPIGAQPADWRDQQIAFIAARVAGDADVLVGGDFNATPWSAAYRSFRRDSALADSAAGQLPWPTWFGDNFAGRLFAVPIDYVFHGAGWRVVERHIGPDIGSDHRPLIVRLARAQAPAAAAGSTP